MGQDADTRRKSRIDTAVLKEMHEAGFSLREIGDHFGVTRERVRQVAKDLGIKPRLAALRERNAMVLREAKGASDAAVAEKLGLTKNVVAMIRRKNGLSYQALRRARFKPAIQAVADGQSIRQAAARFSMSPMTLSKYCEAEGVLTSHGRWGALQHRAKVVPDLLARGHSWDEILDTLSAIEKRDVHLQALKAWLNTNVPNLKRSVAQRARYIKAAEQSNASLEASP